MVLDVALEQYYCRTQTCVICCSSSDNPAAVALSLKLVACKPEPLLKPLVRRTNHLDMSVPITYHWCAYTTASNIIHV